MISIFLCSTAVATMKTFGNGVPGFPICASPVTLVNHTLSSDATHGVLHHFWETGKGIATDRIWVDYFVDGEMEASISFQPSHMCGLAASFLPNYMQYNSTDLYRAGALCGRNSAVGGYYNTFPIPFGKHVIVTVRADPLDCKKGCCFNGYLNVRGTENLPVVLPGSGIPLPNTARLKLQRTPWYVAQPKAHVPIVSVPSGDGLIFMTTLSFETMPVGGDQAGSGYIEGCTQFYSSATEPYPGLVVGTGVEDYFDSSYYFGADASKFGHTQHMQPALMFRHELSGLTYFERGGGYERLSAYRFHASDPLAFSGGGKLLWWVGLCQPPGEENGPEGVTKCGNKIPPHDAFEFDGSTEALRETEREGGEQASGGRRLTPVNVTAYGWYYTW